VEEWVTRALHRWPNVPALYGWLRLDRRGRWLIRGEPISRWQIIDTINRNYSADERGCWYFQNGPQRGYMELEYAPFVLKPAGGQLVTHTDQVVAKPARVLMDEEGALLVVTEHGPGLLADDYLGWALERLRIKDKEPDDSQLAEALSLPSGATTLLTIRLEEAELTVVRLDMDAAPKALGFVRTPGP